jgi:Rrf2 family cysteine metabolism transcriptional repressor
MLRITRKSEYGIIALKYMSSLPAGEVTSAKEISAKFSIPQELMAKTLQRLVKRGLIESVQGARGGYVLAMDAGDISLAAVIEAVEGPLNLVECIAEDSPGCTQLPNCNIIDPFKIIQTAFHQFLTGISLQDLNNEAELRQVRWRPANARPQVGPAVQLAGETT